MRFYIFSLAIFICVKTFLKYTSYVCLIYPREEDNLNMVESISGNGSVQYPDDKSKRKNLTTSRSKSKPVVPVGKRSGNTAANVIGFMIGYSAGKATISAIQNMIADNKAAKALELKSQMEYRQNTIDYTIGGKDGNVNVGVVKSEADIDEILESKSAELKTKLENEGYRYGTTISVTGSYKEPGRSVSTTASNYVKTSYEEKVDDLKAQGFEETKSDKFELDDKDSNHSATLEMTGYDTVTVKKEEIDNRNEENKNFDAVKGSKLGKKDGDAQMVDENTVVQNYQNGAVVQTVYDNPDDPKLTITTTTYPDGSVSVKTDTDIPIKYGIGTPDSENYVEGILTSGTVTEQYTPDGELVYRKTKS